MMALLGVLLCVAGPSPSAAAGYAIERVREFERPFHRSEGWTGADGAGTVELGDGRILWLFGDTWVGVVENGRRKPDRMLNNTAAIQTGPIPTRESVQFSYRREPDGSAASLFVPPDGRGWFWPLHGIAGEEGLILFFVQVEKAPQSGSWGFRTLHSWMARVTDFRGDPTRWEVSWTRLPFTGPRPEGGQRSYGQAVLNHGGYTYVYGVEDVPAGKDRGRHMVLARALTGHLAELESWRFSTRLGWSAWPMVTRRLCDRVGFEYSVSSLPGRSGWALVTSENGLSSNVHLRRAPHPEGPWGPAERIYVCPEGLRRDEGVFCYAAKGHPEMSAPGELLITYITNVSDAETILADPDLYVPRVLRLRLP